LWEIPDVAMPVEKGLAGGQIAQQQIPHPVGGEPDFEPADLLLGVPVNLRSQCLGDQLRPQADTKNGLRAIDRLGDYPSFDIEEGQGIVDGHRSAEEDQSSRPIDGWHVSLGTVQIHVLKRDASSGEGGFNKSRTLKENVTKSENLHYLDAVATWKWLKLSAYFETPLKSASANLWR